jgi:hypothetical protein
MSGTRVYVRLLNEGVDVWRPVDALWLRCDVYQLSAQRQKPEDEEWEFGPGEFVRCRERTFSNGTAGLIAFERALRRKRTLR